MHLGARHNICKTDCSWDKAQWWLGTSSNLYAAFIYLVSSAHDNVADGRDGVRLHCVLEEEEVELFDDESKYLMWTLFFRCVASYEWVEILIHPEDNDIPADDKWQLHGE